MVGKRKPGFSNDAIIDSFMEDFDKATRSTGDIQYAQEEVIKAYKTTFKNFPGVSDAIDAAVADFDRKARRDVFQNVADDPEVRGMDMMAELEGEVQTEAKHQLEDTVYLKTDRMFDNPLTVVSVTDGGGRQDLTRYKLKDKDGKLMDNVRDEQIVVRKERGFSIYDLEEIDAFDEALNDMALERAEVAKKLDAMQNDLEATLSQDEIDTLSDAIVLLRKK